MGREVPGVTRETSGGGGGGAAAVDRAVTALLADTPILLYPFDLPAFDRSTNASEPTTGSISSTTGPVLAGRRAVKFPTANLTWNIPYAAWMNVTAMSISVWFKRAAITVREPLLTADATARPFVVLLNADGSLGAYPPGSGPVRNTVTTGLDNDAWHHFGWSQTAGGVGLFVVDGVQDSTYISGGSLANANAPWALGGWATGGDYFHGSMALLAAYNTALTLGQFQAHRNAALT